jgi:hypothetical protein
MSRVLCESFHAAALAFASIPQAFAIAAKKEQPK